MSSWPLGHLRFVRLRVECLSLSRYGVRYVPLGDASPAGGTE